MNHTDPLFSSLDPESPVTLYDRRSFVKVVLQATAAVGVTSAMGTQIAEAVGKGAKPSVIWLHFQECTGCTESLLRTSQPDIAEFILDHISLDYHETLMVAAGHQAEEALHDAMKKNAGKYILIVEGAIPEKENGIYCRIAGKNAIDMLKEVAGSAALTIAIGSCASWGGIPSADPNPTGASGVSQILRGTKVVNLPGCPANPYILLGIALQFAVMGVLPELDGQGRPKVAYGRTIHDHCPRRAHFDAGRFANTYGDEGHRLGYCLYKLGCKGPSTHASCSTNHFCEVVDAWPIGIGSPCFGCTEKDIAFRVPLFSTTNITRPTPPDTYPEVSAEQGLVDPIATGVAGLVAGGMLGSSVLAAKMLREKLGINQTVPPPADDPNTEERS
ncbi:MAG: hydrogenase small subunit [Bacteroidetes bacterium]|nr:MAG: hydrogenase small subunit [Bacteroidota bacterium]